MDEEAFATFIGLQDYTRSIGHLGQLCLQCDMPIIGLSYIYSSGRMSLAGQVWMGLNQALYSELIGQCTLLQQGGQIFRLQMAELSKMGLRSQSLAQTVFLGIELIRSNLLITGVFWQHSFPISQKYLRFFFIRKFRNQVSGFVGSGVRSACCSSVTFGGAREAWGWSQVVERAGGW